MKIRLAFLIALFSLLTSQVFAKENAIKSKIDTHLDITKVDDREEIKPFQYGKLFAQAEKLFKAAKSWHKIRCVPKSGFMCDKHECNERESTTILTLDKENETVMRCEGKNCETFEAAYEQNGVYYNIQTKGPVGTLIRVLGDYRYKEITTIALDAYVANGECEVLISK